jgi:uncharacterized DUF497 family protein
MEYEFGWTEWNLEHAAGHGVAPEDAEFVVDNARSLQPKRGGEAKWFVQGQDLGGRCLQVICVVRDDEVLAIRSRLLGEADIAAATSSAAASRPRRSGRPNRRTARKVA